MNRFILLLTGLIMTTLVSEGQLPDKINKNEIYTTKSGLQIMFVTLNPTAKQPVKGDKIKLHIIGKLANDSIWANSYVQATPLSLVVGETSLKGLDEGLTYMHIGDSAVMTIPADLGFGASAMNKIPANSVLHATVKLFDVVIPPKAYDTKGKDTVKLPSGLQYIIVNKGTGIKVDTGMKVKVHYTGVLDNGKIFDSSVERGEPISIPIGQGKVIKGWDEGITHLHVGDKARLLIPSNLGYGEKAYGTIPAYSNLIFDIEIISAEQASVPVAYDVKGKDTIKTTSGLKYIIVKQGTGVQPKSGNSVKVNYTGYFTNGKIFDSSVEGGQPFTFKLGQGAVIKGWDEGIALLRVGGKARLIVPYELGYGENGYGPIPAKAMLIFDVELLDVK